MPHHSTTAAAAATAVLSALLVGPTGLVGTAPAAAATGGVVLSELHYDNDGPDSGEFLEVEGPAGTDLAEWSVELVNGNGGEVYSTRALSGVLEDQGGGRGTAVLDYPTNGVQNGSPDAVALVDPSGEVAQFLSYEGTVTAAGGAAVGTTSTDIGVAESGGTPAGHSLQRVDGQWQEPAPSSKGALNGSDGGGTDPAPGCTTEGVVPIHHVQGSGATATCDGAGVRVEGVVTGSVEDDDVTSGYFLQEQDAETDTDPETSEGIHLSCGTDCPTLAAGDVVEVVGEVGEIHGLTRISAPAADVTRHGTDALPTAAAVTLPAPASTQEEGTFEHRESMLTTVSTTLAVSEYYNLSRYGELVMTAGERPYQYTHNHEPTDAAARAAWLAELATKQIVLSDNNTDQNDATTGPDADEAIPFPSGGLSVTNRFRGGDTVTGLTGPLSWSFGSWRVVAQPEVFDYRPEPVNPAPAGAPEVGGDVTVASFNVLNYFTTLDKPGNTCGPSALECRGAHSTAELERQRDKIVAALTEMDADVVGLVEIENDSGRAVEHLLAELNQQGIGTYAHIETGTIGGDAIKVALIYDTATVTPVGDHAIMDASVDPRYDDSKNRPALIQTFAGPQDGRVTVAVNHLKSKGSACSGDPDTGDGQGNCNGTRTEAAQALVDHLATDPTRSGSDNFLVMGDLNSYRLEDPIRAITDAGYTNLVERFQGADAYSYVFDSQLGYLDHALASPGLAEQGEVTGTAIWNINADTPVEFDYNDTVRDEAEQAYERKSTATELYAPDSFRSSDHDPVLVGLDLAQTTGSAASRGLRRPPADRPGPR